VTEEAVVVAGAREVWLDRVRTAMYRQGFKDVHASEEGFSVTGDLTRAQLAGRVEVVLAAEGVDATRLVLRTGEDVRTTCTGCPDRRLLDRLKQAL
jgi:uncharacterized protein (DUF1697 family)